MATLTETQSKTDSPRNTPVNLTVGYDFDESNLLSVNAYYRTMKNLNENNTLSRNTVEGQVTEKSVSAPGRDSGKPQRASVLEKLSDAKKQEKAAPPKAPDKKKEDIHR